MKNATVYMWYKRFEEGKENIKDDQRSGRPSVVTSSHIAAVKQLLDNDRRITIRDILAKTDYSYGTVSGIIHNQLNMRRYCARWIPKMLNTGRKRLRVECCEQLLKRFEREGESSWTELSSLLKRGSACSRQRPKLSRRCGKPQDRHPQRNSK